MPKYFFFIAFLLSFTLTAAAQNAALNPRLANIEKRAKEIEAFLTAQPSSVGRSIADRDAWKKITELPNGANIVKQAEKRFDEEYPVAPEELYKEYYRNGNRGNYQNFRGKKYSLPVTFALAECIDNKGRFLKPLEKSIKNVCTDPSWIYPAHDGGHQVYDGKRNFIDLGSSDVSAEFALIKLWLGDKLSPETRKLIDDNLERRTFSSYEQFVIKGNRAGNWWITGTNNWNAVCHANVVCAALSSIESKERRAFYIAAAEEYLKNFFSGFTPDGYCSEGIGYWNYGFGHFLQLAEIVEQATDGKVNFFDIPKVKNCSLFAYKMEVAPNQFASFADCSIHARPDEVLTSFLNRRLQLGYKDAGLVKKVGGMKSTGVFCFPNSADKANEQKSAISVLDELRTVFSDAGVVICRNKDGLSFVCKAGHNDEHHNHNDIGSFTIMFKDTEPVLDPGGEVYTSRTFSGKRYDSNLLNSWGHPVPVINGKLQKTGKQYHGKILSTKFTDDRDTVVMDIAPAYGLKEIKTLTRQFDYDRKNNTLTVTDNVELTEAGTFETALITYSPFSRAVLPPSGSVAKFNIGDPDKQIIASFNTEVDGKTLLPEFIATEIKEDSTTKKHPARLGFKIPTPITKATITVRIEPL